MDNRSVRGFDVVAKNIERFGGGFIEHVNKTMGTIAKMLDDEITRNANLLDHNLAYLKKLGHPYRHDYGSDLHDPNWKVHRQSGKLLAAKSSGIIQAAITWGELKASAYVTIDEGKAPYVDYIIWGSSKMIPRDFMTESQKIVVGPAMEFFKRSIRDFITNFKPIEIK